MKSPSPYSQILDQIGVRTLGHGCQLAGADLLVCQYATLANVAHPHSGIFAPGGNKLQVGINTLTIDPTTLSLSNNLIVQQIITLQNQHLRNTRSRRAMRLLELREARRGTEPEEFPTFATGTALTLGDDAFYDSPRKRKDTWLYDRDPSQAMAELRNNPSFYFDGRDPIRLTKDLSSCHLQHALVRIQVAKQQDHAALDPIATAITGGASLAQDLPFQIKGHLLASMNPQVLRQILKSPEPLGCIPGSTLWLTSTPLEANASPPTPVGNQPPRTAQDLFEAALKDVISRRLLDQPIGVCVDEKTLEACYLLMEELRQLDKLFPGISAALHSLVPTLIFGHAVTYGIHNQKIPHPYPPQILVSFARALAYRMVQYRRDEVNYEETLRIESICGAVYQKLSSTGPQDERTLSRRFTRLLISDCRSALRQLQSRAQVECIDGQWRISQPMANNEIQQSIQLSISND